MDVITMTALVALMFTDTLLVPRILVAVLAAVLLVVVFKMLWLAIKPPKKVIEPPKKHK